MAQSYRVECRLQRRRAFFKEVIGSAVGLTRKIIFPSLIGISPNLPNEAQTFAKFSVVTVSDTRFDLAFPISKIPKRCRATALHKEHRIWSAGLLSRFGIFWKWKNQKMKINESD